MADLHKKGPFNRDCLSLGSSCPVPRPCLHNFWEVCTFRLVRISTPCLHNFWEVCTFRLVRISTPEDMFASGEEMGKDVVLFTQLATFCFDLPFSSNWRAHENMRDEGNLLLFALDRLHWTERFTLGKSFHERLWRRKFQNNREIRSPDENLCDQNELSEDIVVSRQSIVCFDIHTRRLKRTWTWCRNSYRLGGRPPDPRSTSNEFRVVFCNMADYCSNTICYLPTVKRRDWNRHEHYNMAYA